jgi:redox-sensitive bicupin YhaK (pirin superfamily)
MNAITLTQPAASSGLSPAKPPSDGAGVKLTRVLTHDLQQRLDPFLMLDQLCQRRPG